VVLELVTEDVAEGFVEVVFVGIILDATLEEAFADEEVLVLMLEAEGFAGWEGSLMAALLAL